MYDKIWKLQQQRVQESFRSVGGALRDAKRFAVVKFGVNDGDVDGTDCC